VENKAISIAVIALIAGFAIGFLVANRLNRSELESLRSENARLKEPPANGEENGATLSDDEIRTRIKKADDDPGNLEYQRNLGIALYRYASMKKDVPLLNESTRLLKRVLEADKSSVDANTALGNAYFDIGYFSQDSASYAVSRQYYEVALKQRPDDSSVRTDYGLTFFLQQPPDYDRALAEFEKSLRSDPKNEKALEFTTQAYLKKNDTVNAQKALDRLKTARPDNASIAGLTAALATTAQPAK